MNEEFPVAEDVLELEDSDEKSEVSLILIINNRIFVHLSVPKDLAHRSTDIVLLYRGASHGRWEDL